MGSSHPALLPFCGPPSLLPIFFSILPLPNSLLHSLRLCGEVPSLTRRRGEAILPRMATTPHPRATAGHYGCAGFAAYVEYLLRQGAGRPPRWVVLTVARDCANVDVGRLPWRPLAFWRGLRTRPPVTFGPAGFRPTLVDDSEPARHYAAFLGVGYFLPAPLDLLFARLWERAEGIVFRQYSAIDLALAELAVRHGRRARREGPAILPALIRADLCIGYAPVA